MRIQESLVTDKQIALELFSENGRYRVPIEGQDFHFPSLEKVHEAFLNQSTYDTIKLTHNGNKSYLHLFMDEIEVFDTKKALRQRLSQDSQGMWAEIRNGKTHYYVEERGWITTSYKEITEQECIEKLQHTSTITKALGIGLGILALLPGAMEFARRLPIGTKEAAMGLVALNQKSPLLGAVGYSLLPKAAEAQAVGTEFQVNTYTTNYQGNPNVILLNDGGFVVVWESSGQDGANYGIFGQRYDSSGVPAGIEFQVNTYTTSNQSNPKVAPLNDGGFVVIWQSTGQDGDGYGIFGQRYDSSGVAVGIEFQINTYTTLNQQYPSIAPLDDGGFVVTWQSNFQDGDLYGIYGQRYASNGSPAGSEFQVNTYTTSEQRYPTVALLSNGGFVVTWQSRNQDGDLEGIYGQRYDANGDPAGTEFQINTYTTSYQQSPSVAALDDGGFVVTWASDGQDGDSWGIFGQRYDSSGVQVGLEFQVNTYTTDNQYYPAVVPLNDGGFVVTWESNGQDGSLIGVFGQRVDSNGSPAGSEFLVNTYTTGNQQEPTLCSLVDGGFVVIWQGNGQDGDGDGVFGQRFDASGNPIELQIPTSTISASKTTSPTPILPGNTYPTPTLSPSAARSSLQTTISKQSNLAATSSSKVSGPTSSSPAIASVKNLVYGESYPVLINDQIVCTYIVSGGSGLLDSNNPNVISFECDGSFQPEEGEVLTLFTIPEEDVALWESIEIEGESIECLEPHGYVSTKLGDSSYQIIFEEATCLNVGSTMFATALPLTLN